MKIYGGANYKIGVVIQCTAGDLYPDTDPALYCIKLLKESSLFDSIVLAVPDVPESGIFESICDKWAVRWAKGSNFNIAERFLTALEGEEVDIVVRVLLRRFYLDVNLVEQMIEELVTKNADYVKLARDFNYELAADVFSYQALKKAGTLLEGPQYNASFRFSPWFLMDQEADQFYTIEHSGCENYSQEKVKAIKERLVGLLEENQVSYGWDFPASAYAFVEKYLKPTDCVLDIATGKGDGARRLHETCKTITGVDIDATYIEKAKVRFAERQGLSFVACDAQVFHAPQQFDAIVSMHTLEHLDQPAVFLEKCAENLKPDGWLYIEVPLLLPRPLGEPLYPFHQKEFLVEELEGLLLNAGFQIERRFGRDRGVYTEFSKAREAVQYHCCLKKNIK